ncbi:hypothetical protein R3W88_013488 [Solanum pinnatisectum]|uniref:NB-ARC domain-containing protein n=1 Tax=Solanum pinnatisectum TaxID=50273 RepID=A0AAV9KNS0_9SOLN|nr:hypothetical protein R3W88_013488 [Solanum pinnatisectum]
MSSYEYLSQRNNYDLSRLEKLGHEWDLGISRRNIKNLIDVLYINLKFLDMLLILQSFTNVCCNVTQNVQDLFPYAAAEFKRIISPDDIVAVFYNLEEHIWEAKLEIRAKYSFPEASLPLSSNVASPELVKRFIDTFVMNLSNLPEICNPYSWYPLVPFSSMEEIVKELKLLRNFVYFISDRCRDPQSQYTLFTHVLVLSGHAATISWLNALFSDLPMSIQPIQSCIRKIYIDVLQTLKSGCHPNIQAEHIANHEAGFVETLIHYLDEHKEIVAFKDQRAILQEMLIFLRDNLINLPRDVLEDLDTTIIDIGLLVYSLYESVEEKEDIPVGELNQVTVLDFSGNIQSIRAVIYRIIRKSFQSNLPKIDGLGSIDIILDHLEEFLSRYSDSFSSIKSQLWTIQQQLEHFQKHHDGFGSFAMQVIAKAYEVDHLVVGCIYKNIPQWCLFLWTRDIIEEITLLMREVAEIQEKKVSDLVLHNTTANRVSPNLDVISIVGMPGLGKTTLASKLYHDDTVVSHFDVRAQCCVSQVYARKDLLLTILCCVKRDTIISDKLPVDTLADKLRKLLMVQRYLILVDDVWETSAWDDLEPCFYDAGKGSRIILTTRLGHVAFHAKLISNPRCLRLFTQEESWMLLKNKAFNTESCSPVLEDVGQKIAKRCGRLPLSVVVVAGILETMEKEKHCWEQVAINLGSRIRAKSEDIINLSYQVLPFHLKLCFLYFGVFLEDEEIQVSKLTWLWIAEGLVKSHKEKLSEDVAEDHLKNLIGRNLVMISKKSCDGKTKTCRIHDLLLDFCKKKAKVENFLQCIKGDNDNMNHSSISYKKHCIPRRLCLNFQGDNLAEWSSIYLEFTVIDSFPEVTCLRYAAVRIAEDSSLSFSSNLWNLETLIVKGIGGRVSLPDTLWKMIKLRHLHIYTRASFTTPNVHEELLKSLPKMKELRTLASVWFSCKEDVNNILARTPNLQKLRCEVSKCDRLFPAFNNITKLEMLKFSGGPFWTFAEMNLPPCLKKLTLFNCCVYSLDQVATLPALVVLKLLQVTFCSKVWEVTDEQFPQLKFLKVQVPNFSEWEVSDDAFPCLEHLIPSRFADMLTLKSIELISCKESLVESAKDIREIQVEEMQNCGSSSIWLSGMYVPFRLLFFFKL